MAIGEVVLNTQHIPHKVVGVLSRLDGNTQSRKHAVVDHEDISQRHPPHEYTCHRVLFFASLHFDHIMSLSTSSDWESASSFGEGSATTTSAFEPSILKFSLRERCDAVRPDSETVWISNFTCQSVNTGGPLTAAHSPFKASQRVKTKKPLLCDDLGPLTPSRYHSIPPHRDVPCPVYLLPAPTYSFASVSQPSNFAEMESINVPELVGQLGSAEDAVRKMAAFKLQSNIGDPSFAEMFMQEGGLQRLRALALNATGNTLAYSLTSFSRLLEVDKGWDFVEQDLIKRVSMPSTQSTDSHFIC
jgi:hypothetical protein